MDSSQRLRAVKMLTWAHTGAWTAAGSIEWTPSGWLVEGDAGWLLTEYNAGLVFASGLRQVTPDEGVLFLYAVWYSMRATYINVELAGADGRVIPSADLLADLDYLKTQ